MSKDGDIDQSNNNSEGAVQYITKEEFAAVMRDQQSRIANAMDTFGDQVSQAIMKVQPTNNKNETPTNKDGSDIPDAAVKLIDNPDDYISKIVDKKLSQDNDIDMLRNDMFLDRVGELERDYDNEFGDGAFREHILPDLMKAASELPTKMRASKSHMRMLYQGIRGGLPADKLVEKRLAVKQAEKDAAERRSAPPMLRGIGVPRQSGDKLDADESAYLDSLSKKGIKYSKEDYLRDREMSGDIDSMVEAMRKSEAKK